MTLIHFLKRKLTPLIALPMGILILNDVLNELNYDLFKPIKNAIGLALCITFVIAFLVLVLSLAGIIIGIGLKTTGVF